MRSRGDMALVAYVPVPHSGYLKLFRAHAKSMLYVLGNEFINDFQPLVRNLPAVKPEEAQNMIQALDIFSAVRILAKTELPIVREFRIVMPDEDVSRSFAEKYFAGKEITFDDRWRLRWDWGTTTASRRPEGERAVSTDVLDREFMHEASREASRSPDWWRQIGALLVKDGRVVLAAFNRHVPNEQSAYCYGDPRSNFEPGQRIECSSALHAEAGIVAEAARQGFSTEGCDLYVSTFPCPPCAYLVAFTGIKRLFYAEGYSLVAGAETLQANGVEIIRIEY